MSYFESLSFPEKINYFFVMCPGRAFAAILCLCFSLLALVLVLQCFIPALRRLYERVLAFVLPRLGLRQRVQEYAALLGAYGAWLGFSGGLCLLPICLAFYADAATHHGGGLSMGYLIVFGPISFLLMVLAFLICTGVAFHNWRRLQRRNLP